MVYTPVLRVMGFKVITLVLMAMVNTLIGFSVWAEEFVICRGSSPRTIKCDGSDEVIDVQDAQLLLSKDTNHCTDPNIGIIGRIESGEGVTCKEQLPFTNCHGRRECNVDDNLLGIAFSQDSCTLKNPNIFYVRYFCYSFKEDKVIKMNNHHKEVTGQIIDLISPSFPCNMTEQIEPYTLTCTASPERKKQNELVKFYAQYKLIHFAPSNCAEKIYLRKEGYNRPEDDRCSSISNAIDLRNEAITRQIRGSLHIAYQNTRNHPAGAVWVQVEVKKNGQPIDVTVSCSHTIAVLTQDQACIPISLSNDTVVDMTTITTATTTTTEASSTFTEVTIEQSVTNTTPTTMLQESKENEDSKVMQVVLGTLLGLICIAAFAVLSIIYLIRKRKKNKTDNEMDEQTQSAQSGSSTAIYSVAASIDECNANEDVKVQLSGNEKEEIQCDSYDDVGSMNTGDVYAKVDKSKKTAKDTDETNADETLMVENDDLYDTGKNPDCEPEDEYNSENDDEHIYDIPNKSNNVNHITNNNNNVLEDEGNEQSDETLVIEENETNKDDAKEKDQIKGTTTDESNRSSEKAPMHQDDETDNDSVVMYENSEIYSSSVDLNEEGEQAEKTIPDVNDEKMSENTAENPQKKMSYSNNSDIGKENELYY